MYDYFIGKLTYKNSSNKGAFATIEVGSIGYSFEIIERDFIALPDTNSDIKLYSVLQHREDKMSLCGFIKREDRDIFNTLTSVSGVGPKMALMLINTFEVSDLVGFVLEGNYKELTRAKGVGPKLAQKIILELKDKLNSCKGAMSSIITNNKKDISSENIEDAQMVLLSLGYEKKEIENALSKAVLHLNANSSAEEILKESLKILSA